METNDSTNREVFILDEYGPEAIAMMQALYSRDPRSVRHHIEQVKKQGVEKFMSTYYVGYGHKSIGDCGSTTIFIESISMLAAKAVQDWPLYSGQEASTRYLDMSKQTVMNPLNTKEGWSIQNRWMNCYERVLHVMTETLPNRFPKKEGEDEGKYQKAIKAKAFDIARGFLPAGVTTYVSWHSNLRQTHDHLKEMRHHPLLEIREIAENVLENLKQKYPSSFGYKLYEKDEEFVKTGIQKTTYFDLDPNHFQTKNFLTFEHLSGGYVNIFKDTLSSRPEKSDLPKQLRICGDLSFQFLLDFGSFRDFQRQRSVVQLMPLLATHHGFEEWYLDQLGENLRSEVEKLIEEQTKAINDLNASPETKQYYIAMGYKVLCVVRAPLTAAVYVAELRTQQTVHPTLRKVAQEWGRAIKKAIPEIALYCNNDPDELSIKRGEQDIVKKEEG